MTDRRQDDRDNTELLTTGSAAVDGDRAALPRGARLGDYRIERLLGRGGMGEVYLAEQLQPVRRKVALKLLRGQRLDPRQLARFELERQLLAQMRHPAIAQIHDAGTTGEGHPYFVMEYIDGQPIDAWCAQHGCTLRTRLELFIRVCEGVQHAHQKGVVHRDLKPGNVLVTEVDGRGLPRIIDFGIATANDEGTVDAAGTPDYMSPEQLAGSGLDTRSDVYALGVMLYELLTGERPQRGGQTVTGHARSLRLPSEHLRTLPPAEAARLATGQGLALGDIQRVFSHELDWVVDKALRHDREERYPSASALAADLRNFLDGRPLQAVPPTRRYLWAKFAQRHRAGMAAAAVALAALLGGLALSLYGLQQARQQRELAERRSIELEKVVAFQQSMLEGVDIQAMGRSLYAALLGPEETGQHTDAMQQALSGVDTVDVARGMMDGAILKAADAAIVRDFSDEPELAAELRLSVAKVRNALGLYRQAADDFASVAQQRETAHGAADPRALEVRRLQLSALNNIAAAEGVLPLARQVSSNASALPQSDPLRLRLQAQLAQAMAAGGDRTGGRDLLEEVYRTAAAAGACQPASREIAGILAQWRAQMGEASAGRELLEPLLRDCQASGSETSKDDLQLMQKVTVMRAMSGDAQAALPLQRTVVETTTRQLGSEHPATLAQRLNYGTMMIDAGEWDAALPVLQEVLQTHLRVYGPGHPLTLKAKLNLASLYARLQRFDEALALQADVTEARTRLLGPQHPDTVFIRTNQVATLAQAGQAGQALALAREVLPLTREVLGPEHPQVVQVLHVSAVALDDLGRRQEAIAAMRQALDISARTRGADAATTRNAAGYLALWLRQSGQEPQARALIDTYLRELLDEPAANDRGDSSWLKALRASERSLALQPR